jgi:BetI-type transcriptional repressor, C-terminal
MWIDSWGEALRSEVLRDISQELDIQSTEFIERVIVEGVESGEFRCEDPHATAWVLSGLLDGLGVQLTVHEKVIDRAQVLRHARRIAASELGVTPGDFERAADAV